RSSLAEMRERTADPMLLEQVRIEMAEMERRREQASRPPPTPAPPARVEVAVAPQIPNDPPPPRVPAVKPPDPVWPPPGTILFWGYLRRVDCGEKEKVLTVSNRIYSIKVRERASAPARIFPARGAAKRIACSLHDLEVNVVYRPAPQFGPLNGDLVAVLF